MDICRAGFCLFNNGNPFLTQSGKEEAFKMLGLIFGGTGLFFFLIGVIF